MAALIAFFATPLGKVVLSVLISLLQKTGLVTWAEALCLKFGEKAVEAVENLKVDPDYTGTGNDPLPPVTTNLTTKDGLKVGS